MNIRRCLGDHSTETRIILSSGTSHITHFDWRHRCVTRLRRRSRYCDVIGEIQYKLVARVEAKGRSFNRHTIVHLNVAVMREAGGADVALRSEVHRQRPVLTVKVEGVADWRASSWTHRTSCCAVAHKESPHIMTSRSSRGLRRIPNLTSLISNACKPAWLQSQASNLERPRAINTN
jgi:hypothetical protein